jgi:3,4-dihydroxy-2-butanone 4-phosphate synthase
MRRNAPELAELLREARRAVALGKLSALERQASAIGELVQPGQRAIAADTLFDIAQANGLIAIHGEQLIAEILAAGFGWSGA